MQSVGRLLGAGDACQFLLLGISYQITSATEFLLESARVAYRILAANYWLATASLLQRHHQIVTIFYDECSYKSKLFSPRYHCLVSATTDSRILSLPYSRLANSLGTVLTSSLLLALEVDPLEPLTFKIEVRYPSLSVAGKFGQLNPSDFLWLFTLTMASHPPSKITELWSDCEYATHS